MSMSWEERKARYLAKMEAKEPGFRKAVESRQKARENFKQSKDAHKGKMKKTG